MNNKPEMECLYEIWSNDDDWHYEVGPDRDSLGCVEIRYKEKGKTVGRMTFPPEIAELIAQAIIKTANDLKTKE